MHRNRYLNKIINLGYYLSRLPLFPLSPFKKKPDFLIIGTQKGGTSSLHFLLDQHEQTALPRKKELHFFSKYYGFGTLWYQSFFPFKWSKKITGEATPNYIYFEEVALRVFNYKPDMKFIVLLRDPIDRAVSQYFMEKAKKNISQEFEDMIIKELDSGIKATQIDFDSLHNRLLVRGKYYNQLQNWLKYFSPEQFLFLKSEDFFQEPKSTLDKVYIFLGLKKKYPNKLAPKNIGKYPEVELSEKVKERLLAYYYEEYHNLYALTGIDFKVKK